MKSIAPDPTERFRVLDGVKVIADSGEGNTGKSEPAGSRDLVAPGEFRFMRDPHRAGQKDGTACLDFRLEQGK